jgi:[lysine-biosynthesis-protein LysW]---L-2-aminoadipate ligase
VSGLLIAGRLTPTNVALRDACGRVGIRSRLLPIELAYLRAQPGEIVLGRVDVRASLDGPEDGLDALRELEDAGSVVLNRADALLRAHDKLETARSLAAAGLPHPRTAHVRPGEEPKLGFEGPYVVKPRFGSWGMGVARYSSIRGLRRALSKLEGCSWYREQGVLVQELVPNSGIDVRVVVAGGTVVGAVSRVAAPDEWRTNVALGGRRKREKPSLEARALALAAAQAVGADLVGVDLLPTPDGYVALELNGCVDFTADYSLGTRNVFEEAVAGLVFPWIAELAERVASTVPSASLELQPVGS